MFCSFIKMKNTIKAGGSTATKMWTGWVGEWVIPLRLLRLLEHLAVLKSTVNDTNCRKTDCASCNCALWRCANLWFPLLRYRPQFRPKPRCPTSDNLTTYHISCKADLKKQIKIIFFWQIIHHFQSYPVLENLRRMAMLSTQEINRWFFENAFLCEFP